MTGSGKRIDVLLVNPGSQVTVYQNLGDRYSAIERPLLAGLRQCMADLSLKRGFVITTGEERRSIGKAIEILPWHSVARGEVDIV